MEIAEQAEVIFRQVRAALEKAALEEAQVEATAFDYRRAVEPVVPILLGSLVSELMRAESLASKLRQIARDANVSAVACAAYEPTYQEFARQWQRVERLDAAYGREKALLEAEGKATPDTRPARAQQAAMANRGKAAAQSRTPTAAAARLAQALGASPGPGGFSAYLRALTSAGRLLVVSRPYLGGSRAVFEGRPIEGGPWQLLLAEDVPRRDYPLLAARVLAYRWLDSRSRLDPWDVARAVVAADQGHPYLRLIGGRADDRLAPSAS